MAIVFQSPKKKQRIFFLLVMGLLVILLVVLALVTFLPELNNRFKDFPLEDTMSIPEIKINFAVMDSQQTQTLQLFGTMRPQEAGGGRPNPFAPN